MTRDEQLSVLRETLKLVDCVQVVSTTPIRKLSAADIGEPAARADRLRIRLVNLIAYLQREPYLRGEREVVLDSPGSDRWGLVAADDVELIVAPYDWPTRESAEGYARAQGMKLAAPEVVNA